MFLEFCCVLRRWMLVNFDCSALWVRNAEPLKAALSLTPEFLRAKGNTLDYKVWRPSSPHAVASLSVSYLCCIAECHHWHRFTEAGLRMRVPIKSQWFL